MKVESFELIAKQGKARRGRFYTAHGVIETPAFMNVATGAAIKGALDSTDLEKIGCQVALANTYHLHLRPGDELIRSLGGLHKFMNWSGPILTDSGGFQVYSLAKLRKITEEGVTFNSHIDGKRITMTPEDSVRIQLNLGADIIMAFDECIGIPAERDYVEKSCDMTYRWLVRCMEELRVERGERREESGKLREESVIDSVIAGTTRNPPSHNVITKLPTPSPQLSTFNSQLSTQKPLLFGINQGATFEDIRISHMKRIAELDLPGYAIGGLAVGESAEQMYDVVETVEEHMPENRPRYLMGVGTPENIIEAVARGVDLFDCVLPARNGRHGKLYTHDGSINIKNEQYKYDESPIDLMCVCHTCKNFSRAYLRHLFSSGEMLAMRLAVIHNLHYFNKLMAEIRNGIET